mmetsp:Transcript_18420/g.71165  ORF Transcript_18420/g.71165 Transcript_18420/m.71165 type:complete len:299 (+) Transcript_18420:68-964(+)|eukprot:CAMPEP_0114628144 /NCGR_PEP_ID=MMETSP0168-20121206/12663_1 /TAXON_ID=95228 ORGANISM="Vannella sp., Strain DIVA3 517/6/12" /NCGR_SAMPLE_ID=MMETSP0168 /ASSEMBLY_ACC=CAM_ASM_000044 /LENGTH=298 /DNA_ID=CAMNT_0001839505 /DNA_START=1 /DNA_END=897 /DNA_ORIENTATION=-
MALHGVKMAFVGAGQMACHFMQPLLRNGIVRASDVIATQPSDTQAKWVRDQFPGVKVITDNREAVEGADMVFVGVKPVDFLDVAKELNGPLDKNALVVSFMAAVPMQTIQQSLQHERLCRCMPNTPVKISRGTIPWVVSPKVSETQAEQARQVFTQLGTEIRVSKESYIDMSTSIVGSAPSYYFLIMEAMTEAGVHLGLPRHHAEQMVLKTMQGTVEYAVQMHEQGQSFSSLKAAVTSPGGTTASALYQAEKHGLRATMSDIVWAAYRRSLEMAKSTSMVFGPGVFQPTAMSKDTDED